MQIKVILQQSFELQPQLPCDVVLKDGAFLDETADHLHALVHDARFACAVACRSRGVPGSQTVAARSVMASRPMDKGMEYYEARHREQQVRSLMKRAQQLGFQVVAPTTA